jgi:hypothetical protein
MHTDPAAQPASQPASPWALRLLAAAVIAQPLSIGVNSLFHPQIEFSAAGLLAGASAGPTRWYAVHIVAALGALLLLPGAFGLRMLVPHRGRRLATAGVVAAVVGAVCLTIAFVAEASVLRLAASPGIDQEASLAIAERFVVSPEFYVTPVGIVGATLAGLLLPAALLRARTAPRWPALLYLGATLSTLAAVPGSPWGPLAWGAVTVAAVALALRLVKDGPAPALQPAAESVTPAAGADVSTLNDSSTQHQSATERSEPAPA